MDKRTIYVIIAVAVVLLFLIEPFAIGMMQSAGNVNAGGDTGGDNSTAAVSFTGNAIANITIVRYEPYLIVSGNGSGVEAVKERLMAGKRATYAVWSGDSLVVSLKSSKDVPAAALEFENANASVLASAYIATSDKVAVTDSAGKETVAQGTSISMQVRPIYEEGSTHEAQFAARVDAGQVTGMGALSIAPAAVLGIPVEAMLSSAPQATYTVRVAFKDRAAAKQLATSAGAAYKERSFIYVENASKEQLDAAVSGMAFVTGTQPGVISVQNDFVDSEGAGAALFKKGLSPVFPDSLATFANASEAGAQGLVALLSAANITSSLTSDWSATIRLPSALVKDGKQYMLPSGGLELLIEGTGAPANATSMNVSVDVEVSGSKVTRVTSVNPV